MSIPADTLGADLIWWRSERGWATTVTLFWGAVQPFDDRVHLEARLFDASGSLAASWRMDLAADRPVLIDSGEPGPWRGAGDGILALYACTEGPPSEPARRHFHRLYPLVDWRGPGGEMAHLHSDQVIQRGRHLTQRITEVVIAETADEHNALVILNGEEAQAAGALEISVRSASGDIRTVRHARAMAPFSVNRIGLREAMPDLARLCDGGPATVSARFASRGLFTRPYVETTGARYGAYHAGDVYEWAALPHFVHALIGGEVDPAAVIHDATTRTFVNLLHSHGDFEADVPVDARLYDLQGRCVAERAGWLIASRHGLARADVAGLLPDPSRHFRGHIALSFSAGSKQAVPRRLQALVEYRSAASVAHVMTWSDEWNSVVRLARRDRMAHPVAIESWCRVLQRPGVSTEVAITHAGHPGYARAARVQLRLLDARSEVTRVDFELEAFATRFARVDELFPQAAARLAPTGLGVLVASSASDLANMAFTRRSPGGSLAAEHFMPLLARAGDGRWVAAAGR
ncbi:hypothetical protein [Caenimonas aquaedulcis]|uniref:Uncharacterized protein n=1 Tax=Caenimonas aquaedulcis TaxID=2793270 RepID=A0A931H605_9BURK|nr:hypothetical protein [Caenimonas aquaedulcis]MBG9389078.1 hypothetical protein [Caenimonas aquaedulcis]